MADALARLRPSLREEKHNHLKGVLHPEQIDEVLVDRIIAYRGDRSDVETLQKKLAVAALTGLLEYETGKRLGDEAEHMRSIGQLAASSQGNWSVAGLTGAWQRYMEAIEKREDSKRKVVNDLIAAWAEVDESNMPTLMKLVSHCLRAQPKATLDGFPQVPFDVVFGVRDGIWDHYVRPQAAELPEGTALMSPTGEGPPGLWAVDGQALLAPRQAAAFRDMLARRAADPGSSRVVIDVGAGSDLEAARGALRASTQGGTPCSAAQVAMDVRSLDIAARGTSKINLTFAARHFVHFEKVYQHLSARHNSNAYVELQGKARSKVLPAGVHDLLHLRFGVQVRFLQAMQHHAFVQSSEPEAERRAAGRGQVERALTAIADERDAQGLYAGLDIAGAEDGLLDGDKLAGAFDAVCEEAERWGRPYGDRPLVLRVHAAEGYASGQLLTDQDVARSRANGTTLLKAASAHRRLRELLHKGTVELRVGHGTHLDRVGHDSERSALYTSAVLGVKIEHNNQSNLATGSDRNMEMQAVGSAIYRNAVYAEARKSDLLSGEQTAEEQPIKLYVSTDSNGVMNGEISDNWVAFFDKVYRREPPSDLSPTTSAVLADVERSSSSEKASSPSGPDALGEVTAHYRNALGVQGGPELLAQLRRSAAPLAGAAQTPVDNAAPAHADPSVGLAPVPKRPAA